MKLNSVASYIKDKLLTATREEAERMLEALGFDRAQTGAYKTVYKKEGCEFVVKFMDSIKYNGVDDRWNQKEMRGIPELDKFRAPQSKVFEGKEIVFVFQEKIPLATNANWDAMGRANKKIYSFIDRTEADFYGTDLHGGNCGIHRQLGLVYFDGL